MDGRVDKWVDGMGKDILGSGFLWENAKLGKSKDNKTFIMEERVGRRKATYHVPLVWFIQVPSFLWDSVSLSKEEGNKILSTWQGAVKLKWDMYASVWHSALNIVKLSKMSV